MAVRLRRPPKQWVFWFDGKDSLQLLYGITHTTEEKAWEVLAKDDAPRMTVEKARARFRLVRTTPVPSKKNGVYVIVEPVASGMKVHYNGEEKKR